MIRPRSVISDCSPCSHSPDFCRPPDTPNQDQRRHYGGNLGTAYIPLLLKFENEGSIASEWGGSQNNRRACFYRLTATGRKQLQKETRDLNQTSAIIARFVQVKAKDLQ